MVYENIMYLFVYLSWSSSFISWGGKGAISGTVSS